MKLNIISDIHAFYSQVKQSVMYNLPWPEDESVFLLFIENLRSFWKDNALQLSKLEFKATGIAVWHPETFIVKSYDECLKFLDAALTAVENKFKGCRKDQLFYFSRGFDNIKNFLYDYSLFDKIDVRSNDFTTFIEWMFKHISDFNPEKLEPADYLIVAGDLGLYDFYDEVVADLKEKTKGKFKDIFHIAGNHDHWIDCDFLTHSIDDIDLSHDYFYKEIDDVVFVGCTLWTPVKNEARWRIDKYMNDSRMIPGGFYAHRMNEQHLLQAAWLKEKIELNKDKKVVVFTHHQPFKELIEDDFKHNGKGWDGIDVSEAYAVMDGSFDDINKNRNIKLWCCAHTHSPFDGIIHNVHVVRNPIGYRDHYGYNLAENLSGTWYNKIIEV